jgi:hypothetical protein
VHRPAAAAEGCAISHAEREAATRRYNGYKPQARFTFNNGIDYRCDEVLFVPIFFGRKTQAVFYQHA